MTTPLHKYYNSLKKFSTKTSCVRLPSLLSLSLPMLATSTLPTAEPWFLQDPMQS
ncbi:hypothetical protein DPMN_140661 [Dreissena polymorpha]|uniref:Uncharacterized protein n=1 Tax=Dreissena polymorpha TaxID=45954 RepID=A0A9D4GDX9_DREPO|nr:hypothetical protein DPMN_140661 [Dreissena polymorpha]